METATALKKHAGGRPKGAKDKILRSVKGIVDEIVKEQLKDFVNPAGEELGRLALHAKFEPTRLGAIKEIYDRVLGKAPQRDIDEVQRGPVTIVFQWAPREIKGIDHE